MTPALAAKVLGLGTPAPSLGELRAAYTQALHRAHPDTGGDYPFTVAQIKEANHVLTTLTILGGEPCPTCGGKGSVGGAFAARQCAACGGEGIKKP